jgi:integrase
MSGIYAKGSRLYFRVKVAGVWKSIAAGFSVGQERQARAMLDRVEAQLAAGGEVKTGPLTVARYAAKWVEERKKRVRTWKNDETTLRLHVLPDLGAMRLDEVRAAHVVKLVHGWRARTGEDRMSPKSVYNNYSTVQAMFRDAELDDLLQGTPCRLTKYQLGPKVDSNPEWRKTAVFTREEVEALISDERLPLDRRAYYALLGVAGLRYGEASGLRWRNALISVPEYPGSLSMLFVAFSYDHPFAKGNVTRPVPVHTTLAAILGEWKLAGWAKMMGRDPTSEDLVIPLPPLAEAATKLGPWRRKEWVHVHFSRDLETLGLRHRRGHDMRRTFISLARSNGAQVDILRRVTHKPSREVIEGYTTFEWPVVCREVAKLPIARHSTGKVLSLSKAAGR